MFGRRKTKTLDNSYPMHDGIQFVHHNPNLFNIGDFLCSPRHYFRFEGAEVGATILGGGIFDPRSKAISKFSLVPEQTVVWGAGFRQRLNEEDDMVTDTPFLDWGYRDIMYVPKDRFLPCASCFHPVANNMELQEGTVVFLNDDPKITPYPVRLKVESACRKLGYKLVWNSTSEVNLIEMFKASNRIITNSFHGAYWGLLSGHKVKVLAHSMKFVNLLVSFELDGKSLVHFYNKRNPEEVLEHILQAVDQDFVGLSDPEETKNHFKKLNLDFAAKLVSKGFITNVSLMNKAQ